MRIRKRMAGKIGSCHGCATLWRENNMAGKIGSCYGCAALWREKTWREKLGAVKGAPHCGGKPLKAMRRGKWHNWRPSFLVIRPHPHFCKVIIKDNLLGAQVVDNEGCGSERYSVRAQRSNDQHPLQLVTCVLPFTLTMEQKTL